MRTLSILFILVACLGTATLAANNSSASFFRGPNVGTNYTNGTVVICANQTDADPVCTESGGTPACICTSQYCKSAYVDDCYCKNTKSVVNYTTGSFCQYDSKFPNITRCPVYPIGYSITCTLNKSMGCLCYSNGTCIETPVNDCIDCSDNVYLVQSLVHCNGSPWNTTGMCTDDERMKGCSGAKPVTNCVCYNNGTCLTTKSDRCVSCSNRNVFSVNNGTCYNETYDNVTNTSNTSNTSNTFNGSNATNTSKVTDVDNIANIFNITNMSNMANVTNTTIKANQINNNRTNQAYNNTTNTTNETALKGFLGT